MSTKRSKQREQILALIQASEGHMTADAIHTKLKKEDISVGIATVYRNLNLLYAEGHINRVKHPELGFIYDKNTHDHYHFRCVKCNKIQDVNIPMQNHLNPMVEEKLNCKVLEHEITFEGICESCLKTQDKD